MAESALSKKLKLKPGQRAVVINSPPGYLAELRPLPEGVELGERLEGEYDWVQVFVRDKAELDSLVPPVVTALRSQSLLWIAFPKGSSKIQTNLTRDQGWEAVQAANLKWINLVSVNDTWSAFSLRPYKPGEEQQSFR